MPAFLLAAIAALILLAAPALAKEDRRGDMTFVALDASALCDDCSVVQATGSFGEETIKAYHDFAGKARFKKQVYVILHSPGGSMKAAFQMGEILRNLKVNTIVGRAFLRRGEVEIEPGTCASACVFAFIGGTTRSMPKGSRLGVHSWMPVDVLEQESGEAKKTKPRLLNQETVAELHRQTALYLKYLEEMGIDLRLASLTLRTPYSSIAWVSSRDQSLWSLVTVDSSLSTPADRRWPVLFLRQPVPPTAPAGNRMAAAPSGSMAAR